LAVVGDTLTLNGNDALTGLTGLGALKSVGGLALTLNPALFDLSGLSRLDLVGATLLIDRNDALVDLSPLMGVDLVEGDLVITDNESLPTAEAERLRDNIDEIRGAVRIEDNLPPEPEEPE
jgi:hypothetical protein